MTLRTINGRRQCTFYRPTLSQAGQKCPVFNADSLGPLVGAHCLAVESNPLGHSRLCKKTGCEYLIKRQPAFDACPNSRDGNGEVPRPFWKSSGNTPISNQMVITFVVRLFNVVGPTAILRRVGAVVVNALDGMLNGWPLPHVGIEVLERVEPAVAHDNATATIARIGWNVRISASGLDMCPTAVLRRLDHAVRGVSHTDSLPLQAAAALSVTVSKMPATGNYLVSTIASAFPHGATFGRMGISKHRKPTVSLPSHVNHVHNDNIFGQVWQMGVA